jgi:pimeloyl-ACP methyl ester carboxylesterase
MIDAIREAVFPIRRVRTPALDVAYEEHGPADGDPVVLLHGFPYDPRAFDEVAPALAASGFRVVTPYLRGYGPTRFLSGATMRSGQQAAIAQDLLDLMDALAIPRAALIGYDWGGRAACIVAALWPERVRCLVLGGGYTIQDIAGAATPQPPETEHRLWYQYYFHTARGRVGLTANRVELGRLLWRLWSPTWTFEEAVYARTASSFDNPDFVDVVVHSYRHRFGYAPGDPALEAIERRLAGRPAIGAPTISLCGADDGVGPSPAIDPDVGCFRGRYERRVLPGVGHNIPQEAPEATIAALLALTQG